MGGLSADSRIALTFADTKEQKKAQAISDPALVKRQVGAWFGKPKQKRER